MSYDISLKDPVTMETLHAKFNHEMTGGTYALGGTDELWLNITYNYASYYYEATDGDSRFAHDEVSCYYADGTVGPIETQYGIRGIYGKTGAESIPLLTDMIKRITNKYKKNGKWVTTKREGTKFKDLSGKELDQHDAFHKEFIEHEQIIKEKYEYEVNEGNTEGYWEPTAAKAIRPLYQLISMAYMRPDGVWDGD